MTTLAFTIAGGAWYFLAFVLLMFFGGLVWGSYTRLGSGINHHPYYRRYTDSPGARRRPRISGHEGIAAMSSRGTR